MRGRRPRVAYFRHDDIGVFHYGPDHPMKPLRIKMADCLVHSYKLHKRKNMAVYTIPKASPEDMMLFHEPDYVKFLKVADSLLYRSPKVKKDGMDTDDQSEDGELEEIADLKARFNMDDDCPIFAGIFEFCRISAGGSIEGARMLNEGECDIAINWSGGLHHAKRTSASGFCYVNDIVLGILELLKVHKRVLYVDIDVHHGDGVEEAFFTTDRVMTVSFHKYGDFFPHTGALNDIGFGKGLGYALNLPLKDGMDDISYANLFHPLMQRVMDTYDPGAVVLQCGADSLSQDWLGPFNLTLDGHSFCVKFFRDRGVPLLLLGGGGYTISNVARCWAYETAVAIGQEDISMDIPDTDPYVDYYEPDKKLYVDSSNRTNYNTRSYLDSLKVRFISTLNALSFRPSVQLGGTMFPYPFSAWQKPKRPGSCGKALTDEDIEMDFEKVFSSKPVKTWKDETKAKKEKLIKQSWDVYFASKLPNVRIP